MSLQAGSALSLVQERKDSQAQVNTVACLPENLNVSDANAIIRSSDLSESVDGLPVIQLPMLQTGLLGASRPSSGSAMYDIREFVVVPILLGRHRERSRIFSQGGYIKFLHGIWTP
jgi:hypothetical protein